MIHSSVAFQKFTGITSQTSAALHYLLSSSISSSSSKTSGLEAFQNPSLDKEKGKPLLWSMGLLINISTQVFSIYKV